MTNFAQNKNVAQIELTMLRMTNEIIMYVEGSDLP